MNANISLSDKTTCMDQITAVQSFHFNAHILSSYGRTERHHTRCVHNLDKVVTPSESSGKIWNYKIHGVTKCNTFHIWIKQLLQETGSNRCIINCMMYNTSTNVHVCACFLLMLILIHKKLRLVLHILFDVWYIDTCIL